MEKQKKILVTGGVGYIGSHTVVALLEAGYLPVLVDNFSNSDPIILHQLQELTGKDISLYEADCTRKDELTDVFLNEPDIDGIIHFSAFKAVGESVTNPARYYHNNVASLTALLECMNTHGVKHLVFSSSCTVYGAPDHVPVTEQAPVKTPASPYGHTKQMCEEILKTCYSAQQLQVALLRYFNPIGAHASGMIGELPNGIPNNLVPFVQQTAAGIRSELVINGNDYPTPDGTCIRDYIDVMDLAEAHVKAIQWLFQQPEPLCETINLGVGHGYSVMQVVEAFQKVNQVNVPFCIGPRRPGDVVAIYADNTHARNLLGWKPTRSLEESLQNAWKWQLVVNDLVQ
jgi:UDP-glucose 4-epimerase